MTATRVRAGTPFSVKTTEYENGNMMQQVYRFSSELKTSNLNFKFSLRLLEIE